MSSKSTKHHSGVRSHFYGSQHAHETKGITYSGKLKQWVVYWNKKTKNVPNITEYFITEEAAQKRFSEL